MTTADFLITEVLNPREFFQSLLSLYASKRVILTTWGTIPATVINELAPYKAPQSRTRRLLFRENSFHLNEQSRSPLIEQLGQEQLLQNLSWGVLKGTTSLCVCREWNDISLNSSDIIDETTLFEWLENQRTSGIIGSYEKIVD